MHDQRALYRIGEESFGGSGLNAPQTRDFSSVKTDKTGFAVKGQNAS